MTKKRRSSRDEAIKYEQDFIEKMIPEYVKATGDTAWTSIKVAQWAIENDKWEQRASNAIKELARTISRVARKVTFDDGEGHKIRKYHAWRLGDDQPMFWSPIELISLENMRYSINARRDKLVNGAVKATVDAEHFNKHYNPGDPIVVEANLTKDVHEKRQSTLYEDKPPTSEDGDQSESD